MDKVGRFQITGELGRGGGGVVYCGVDPATGQKVAIKTVSTGRGFSEAETAMLVERLKREASSSNVLVHPNIVQAIELTEADGQAFYVMEFVEGRTVAQIIKAKEHLGYTAVTSIISQTAAALDFAHKRGIVHRDIKPANLMLTANGVVKVADFGTAKLMNQSHMLQLTTVGTMIGSPHYMSPEQIAETGVDGRSDQFSLAAVAYELIVGQRPFEGDFAPAVMFLVASEDAPKVQSIRPELPAALDAVFEVGLAKKKEGRYPTCTQFAEALKVALGLAPAAPVPSVQPVTMAPVAPQVMEPDPVRQPQAPPQPAAAPVKSAGLPGGAQAWLIGAIVVLVIIILLMVLKLV